MKLFKSLVGAFAVLLSLQPLMSWAASSKESKKIIIEISKGSPKPDGSGGSPTCTGG